MYQHIQDLLKSGKCAPEDILCLNLRTNVSQELRLPI